MNIDIIDYHVIIQFRTMQEFQEKMQEDKVEISDIIDLLDDSGVSLLERALNSGKYDMAKYLLDHNAKLNVVSKDGNNEFQYLAHNINEAEAVEIGRKLLDRGVSVMQKDKKYKNTAFFTLCMEAFKGRKDHTMDFLEECFDKVTDVDEENISGFTIRKLICERGSERLKQKLEERYE